jgi:hypothetical protein
MSMQTYNLMKGHSLFCTVICKCSQLFWTHIPTYVIWKATNDNSCLLVGMQLRQTHSQAGQAEMITAHK